MGCKVWIPYQGPRVLDVVGPFPEGTIIIIDGKRLKSLLDMDVLLNLHQYTAEYNVLMQRFIKTCDLALSGTPIIKPMIVLTTHKEQGYYEYDDDCDPDN